MFPKLNLKNFSLALCQLCALAAQAAYDDEEAIGKLSRQHNASTFRFFSDANTSTEVFIVERGDEILISFRGSKQPMDFITDAKFRKVGRGAGEGKVHRGFLAAFNGVRDWLVKQLGDPRKLAGRKIIIDGHSLGGGLSVLCAIYLFEWAYPVHAVYTFGCPRVGNSAFAKYYNSFLGERTFCLVNSLDVITRSPAFFFNYAHVGQQIFLDAFDGVMVNPKWWQKIPSDINALAEKLDVVFLPKTLLQFGLDHLCKHYIERLSPT